MMNNATTIQTSFIAVTTAQLPALIKDAVCEFEERLGLTHTATANKAFGSKIATRVTTLIANANTEFDRLVLTQVVYNAVRARKLPKAVDIARAFIDAAICCHLTTITPNTDLEAVAVWTATEGLKRAGFDAETAKAAAIEAFAQVSPAELEEAITDARGYYKNAVAQFERETRGAETETHVAETETHVAETEVTVISESEAIDLATEIATKVGVDANNAKAIGLDTVEALNRFNKPLTTEAVTKNATERAKVIKAEGKDAFKQVAWYEAYRAALRAGAKQGQAKQVADTVCNTLADQIGSTYREGAKGRVLDKCYDLAEMIVKFDEVA